MISERVLISAQEIENRVEKCRREMARADWNGMLLSAESNVYYFTGYRTHSPWNTFTRPMFLFIPSSGTPMMYTQGFVSPEAQFRAPNIIHKSFDSLLGPTANDLADIFEELGMNKGKVGFEIGFEQRINYQVDTFLALIRLLKDVEVVDASGLLWRQRIIKSPSEIECHRRACLATNYAFERIFDEIREGMNEHEVTAIARRAMLEGGADSDGFVVITSGPGNYGRISGISTNRRLEKGDLLWVDLGAEYNGYWSDFCRAGIVGPIDDLRRKLQHDVHEATMEASKHIRPGVPFSQLASACNEALVKRGYDLSYDCGRMGHGIGLLNTEPPSITIHEEGHFEEGMIINIEPGLIMDNGVFCVEENFVVTKDGAERLSGGNCELNVIKTN